MKKLERKTVIVTGSTSGIGEEQAYAFAREGANVVCTGRSEERLKKVVDRITADGGNAVGYTADIENSSHCRSVAEKAAAEYGGIDALVNTAGVFDSMAKSLEIGEERWRHIFDVNVNGVFYMCNAVLPYMLEKRRGVILNTASISGLTSGPGGAAYVASKHAVIGYTKQLSFEYAGQGIRVNAIAPGSVMTPLLEIALKSDPGGLEKRLSVTPAGRLGTTADIAKLSVFLLSDDSEWIHGAVVTIDGGRLTRG